MSKRVSAEDQIERIIEQARIVERKSVNRMAFLQDVSALHLLGLRQLAREIDQLHDPALEVVSDFVPPPSIDFGPSPSIEAPVVKPPEFAAPLAELTLQVTRMTEAVENLSNEFEKHSEDLEKYSNELENHSNDFKKLSRDFKKLSKRRRKK